MRKLVVPLIALIVLCLAAVYLFIPSQIAIKGSKMVYQPSSSVIRGMMTTSKWSEWLPKEIKLQPIGSLVATIQAELDQDGIKVPVEFSIQAGENNNSYIEFLTTMDNSQWSPFARVQYFLFAKKIQNKLDKVITAASNYYNYNKGIYGFEIVDQIYQMVQQLEQHIASNNGKIKGDPMVNITRVDEKEVYAQVALSIERDIPVKGNFTLKKMVLGNLLSVTVQGDQAKVDQAFEATKQYILDKQKTSPAIPFVIYNTNRLLEKDASRWKSTINYPIY
jgi:hypothetical protein